jgi:hypothetical protein
MAAYPPCAVLRFHRGPMLTGRAYCGRNHQDPTRIVTVIITDKRDPGWTPETQNVYDEGEWRDGILLESLEAFAMLRLLSRGFYVTAP